MIPTRPPLEALVESEDLGLEILHPGGLALTKDLAARCGIKEGSRVLDVASGTGESACFLAAEFGAKLTGLDASRLMVKRARSKTARGGRDVAFVEGDAHRLPFPDASFDAVICECTVCAFDKERAVREMVRVARPGGRVGLHDLCRRQPPPGLIKRRLREIEGEEPETLEGWRQLLTRCGLNAVEAADRSDLIAAWMMESRRRLGISGQIKLVRRAARRWGWRNLAVLLCFWARLLLSGF